MSIVSFKNFAKKFKENLEIPNNYFLNEELKNIKEYDSVGKIKTSLFIEELFDFQIELEVLINQKDLKSLYEYCIGRV
tara:strand:+ start:3656 stop:3889 length:234 start_codon:yes stop_codon:yes gene_type:complete